MDEDADEKRCSCCLPWLLRSLRPTGDWRTVACSRPPDGPHRVAEATLCLALPLGTKKEAWTTLGRREGTDAGPDATESLSIVSSGNGLRDPNESHRVLHHAEQMGTESTRPHAYMYVLCGHTLSRKGEGGGLLKPNTGRGAGLNNTPCFVVRLLSGSAGGYLSKQCAYWAPHTPSQPPPIRRPRPRCKVSSCPPSSSSCLCILTIFCLRTFILYPKKRTHASLLENHLTLSSDLTHIIPC